MKKWIIIVACLLPMWAMAQDVTEEVNRIKADHNTYLYGEGYGETEANADKEAMANLMSKISVQVSSDIEINEQQVNTAEGIDATSVVESVVKTYTAGTLKNTQSIIVTPAPKAYVVRYIKKTEIERVFKAREELIYDYLRGAKEAEKVYRIADALRYYYWASCLLMSMQHPQEIRYMIDGEMHLLASWIPEQIRGILSRLKAEVTKIEDQEVSLLFTYQGKPVTNLDFCYWDGMNYSNLCSVNNGVSQIEMRPGADTGKLKLQYEYAFESQMQQVPELKQLMQIFKRIPYRESDVTVVAGKKAEQKRAMEVYQASVATAGAATHAVVVEQPKEYTKTIDKIITAIKTKNYASVKDEFTDDGYEMFDKLLHYGNATVLGNPQLNFYQMDERVVCRSVPMRFTFKNNNRTLIEDVTFTFDDDEKIESVAFGLDKAARDDIFNRDAAAWNDSVRMVIATFLENYKTAFALKRLDYIRSIFDDDAIIIVGHMTKQAKKNMENGKYIDNQLVKYTRMDKNTYINNLERSFKSNQFINIRFTDNEVKKMGKGGQTYGILIHQDYYSSTYGDTGYLFLMVDLNDIEKPIIKVRTWQPNRDPNINGNFSKNDPYYGLIYGGNFD